MSKKKTKTQRGFGLLETLLTLGAVSALSMGIYMVLKPASATAQVKREQVNLRDLSSAVDRSWGLLGSFQGVSAERIQTDGLAPKRMVDGSSLRTAWGSSISIHPHTLNNPNDGFSVVYPLTPADVCVRLASAIARDAYDIRVDGSSLFTAGELNPNAAATECGRNDVATMEFVYHSGLVAGTAVASPGLTLPPSLPPVSAPGTAPVGGPVGPVAGVGDADPVAPVGAPPAVAPPPPAPVLPPAPTPVNTVTPPPAVSLPPMASPSNPVAACVVPSNSVENQNLNCSAGQYGLISQSRTASWTCPEAWDAPVRGAFSSWTTTSNTCTACPGSSTQTQRRWVGTPSTCAAGQYGQRSWEREQSQSRSVSYNCPAGTTTLPSPSYSSWSSWANTGSTRNQVNTCTSCPAASTQTQRQWVSTVAACPAGQTGSITYEREQQQSRQVSYNCPAGTASLPSPTYGAWSAWANTGATRNTNNTCRSSLSYFWERVVLREDTGGTQSDRTQFQVFSVSGMDTLPTSCWRNPPSGHIMTWRGGGYFPDFLRNNAGCECNASREGWQVSWNQSEYFAYDEDYQLICVGR